MDFRCAAALAATIISALLAAGCQSVGSGKAELSLSDGGEMLAGAQAEIAAPAALPNLPPPADLLGKPGSTRGTSYVLQDLTRNAETFNPVYPNQNVTADIGTGSLVMEPNWSLGSAFTGLAFVTLLYDIDGYDLNNRVHITWASTIPDGSNVWVALSDFDKNRWRWFHLDTSSDHVDVPGLASYFTPQGDLFAVVLMTGTGSWNLNTVRIGTPRPQVEVEVTGPASAFGELTTTFDASGTQSFAGELTYEWDFEGDGIFDDDSGTEATNGHTFSEPGSYNVTVRATDENGFSGTGSAVVSVAGPWVHSLGGTMDEVVTDVQAAPDGTVWACGNVLDGSHYRDIFLLQYAADGQLLQEIYWSHTEQQGGNSCLVREMEIGPDGTVFLLGTLQTATNYETMLQGWSSEGELQWLRLCDNDDFEFNQLRYANNMLIPLGRRLQSGSYRGIYCTFFANGSLQHAYSTNDPAVFNDVLYHEGFMVGDSGLYFCGHTGEIATLDQDLLVFQRVPTEPFGTAHSWGAAGLSEVGHSIAVRGIVGPSQAIVVGTQFTDNVDFQAGLVRLGANEAEAHGPGGFALRMVDLATTPQSLLLVSTLDNSGAFLQQFSNTREFLNSLSYTEAFESHVRAADGYSSNGLLAGGSIDIAGGSFDTSLTDTGNAYDNSWSEVQVNMSGISNPWVAGTIESVATIGPGTQDSGGGGLDAWVSLSQQIPE